MVDRNNPWWTKQLKDLRKAVFASYDRSKIRPEAIENYKEKLNQYKKLCSREKNADWRTTQEKIPNEEGMAEHLKILNDASTPKITVLDTERGSTEPGEETCKAMIKAHFQTATEKLNTEYDISLRITRTELEKKL